MVEKMRLFESKQRQHEKKIKGVAKNGNVWKSAKRARKGGV